MEQKIDCATASDGVSIFYATSGQGPPLVQIAGWLTDLTVDWESPVWGHWWDQLSRDHLLVRYDQRGHGLSGGDGNNVSLDTRVNDLQSVVDALDIRRFALMGVSQAGAVAVEFATRHPDRVSQLVLHGASAGGQELEPPTGAQLFPSSLFSEATEEQVEWLQALEDRLAHPESGQPAAAAWEMLDVQHRLASVRVPSLVLHSLEDSLVPFEEGCRLAGSIAGARLVPLTGRNHLLTKHEAAWPVFLAEVEHFLSAGTERLSASEGVAAAVQAEQPDLRSHISPDGTVTLFFSDIEDSTGMTQRLGDRQMQEVLRAHNSIVRQQVASFGGFEVKSLGDGFMLAFSSGRRAIECSIAIQQALATYNDEHAEEPLRVRMGLHTGEVLKEADDFFGKHVIIAARISAAAEGGQILVSSLLRDLTESGGGLDFGDEREVELKGLPGLSRVYQVFWKSD